MTPLPDPVTLQLPAERSIPNHPPFAPDPEDRGGGLEVLTARLLERGRGLHIVDQLTSGAWGFRLSGDGSTKAVWMAVPAKLQQPQHGAEVPPGGGLGFVESEE